MHSPLTPGLDTVAPPSIFARSIIRGCTPRHFFLCLALLLCTANFVAADFSITPRLTTGVTYTDNVFLNPVEEESDFITFVSPGIDLNLTGRNGALGIAYDPAYSSYSRLPENNFWSHRALLNGWAEIARGTRLEVENTFLKTEDPISETDTTVRRGRESYTTNTATVGVVNRFGAEDLVDLRYVYYSLENTDPTTEDSAYQRPSLLTTYWFVPNRYAVELEGRYTLSDFDLSENYDELDARLRFTKRFSRHFDGYIEYGHVTTDFVNDGEDYQVYSPLIGFTWAERADTRFGASFGYFYRDNEIREDDDGIVGSIDMVHDWAAGSSIAAFGSVGYDRADFGSENLGFNPYYEVRGSITHQLGRRLTGSLTAGYRINLYIDEDPDREDNLWNAGAGLTYQALPWMVFNLAYAYRQVNSNVDVNDYTENRGTLSVTLTPRQAIRF